MRFWPFIIRRNRDYFMTLPDCVVQEGKNDPSGQKYCLSACAHFIYKSLDFEVELR